MAVMMPPASSDDVSAVDLAHGHRRRLRDRFAKTGADGFHDYELLELLLTYAIPRRDVKPLAKALRRRFGSLSGVLDARTGDLRAVRGVGPAAATLVRLTRELMTSYLAQGLESRGALSSPTDAAAFVRAKIAGLPHEAFLLIFLNAKNEVTGHEVLQEGTVDRVAVYPRRVMEAALARGAAALILAHNHPSGHPEPSEEDRRLTRALAQAAKTLDLRLLDHLIVAGDKHHSFAQAGLL